MILLNDKFLKGGFKLTTDELSVIATNDIVFLGIDEKSWNLNIPRILQNYGKRVILKLLAVSFCHFQPERNHELRSLDILTCNIESYRFKGIKSRVNYLKNHILWTILKAVKQRRSGSH